MPLMYLHGLLPQVRRENPVLAVFNIYCAYGMLSITSSCVLSDADIPKWSWHQSRISEI